MCADTAANGSEKLGNKCFPFQKQVRRSFRLTDWIKQGAFEGLNRGRFSNQNGLGPIDNPTIHQPRHLNAQYAVKTLLDNIPDSTVAAQRACVRAAGWSKQVEKDPTHKSQWNKGCGPTSNCYTLDDDGLFVASEDVAKTRVKKQGVGSGAAIGANGFCLPVLVAKASNVKAKTRNTRELSLLNQRVQTLSREVARFKKKDWVQGCQTDEIV